MVGKKSQRKNRDSLEAILIKKSEGTLFTRLHLPSSSASFSRKIKKKKGHFSITGKKEFLKGIGKRFSFFLIGYYGVYAVFV